MLKTWLITHGSLGRDNQLYNVAMAQVNAPTPEKAIAVFNRTYPKRVRTRFPHELGKGD